MPPVAEITTLSALVAKFYQFLQNRINEGKNAPAMLRYYQRQIEPWVVTMPPDFAIKDLRAYHLEDAEDADGKPLKLTWHRVSGIQRLFNWARRRQRVVSNPFEGIEKPKLGNREKRLKRHEEALLLLACDRRPTRRRTIKRTKHRTKEHKKSAAELAGAPVRPTRWLLLALRKMGARPGECRRLVWGDYYPEDGVFRLGKFKMQAFRADGAAFRTLIVDASLKRVLEIWRSRRNPKPTDHVFLNGRGRPWTAAALRTRVTHARCRLGWSKEVVAYTMRHTAGTRAAFPEDGSPGASVPEIAAFFGHADLRMAAKYIHADSSVARRVAEKANARGAQSKKENQKSDVPK